MKSQLSPTLTYTFLIHFIIAGIFGLCLLLIPAQVGSLYGMATPDLYPWRMLGAAMLGIASTSWFGYKADTWEGIRIVLVLEVVWPILGCLVILYENLIVGVTAFNWINFAIMAIFAGLFTYFYFRK